PTQPNPTQPNPYLSPCFSAVEEYRLISIILSARNFTGKMQELHPNPTNHYQPKVKHMLLTVNEREAMDSTFYEFKFSLLTIEGLFTIPYEHLFTN
ncbi:hypothetical protein, partial [Paenibacillus odorifer]